jgi:ketosteroid isomerase-like protein
MATRAEILKHIASAYDARTDGDIPRTLAHFAPDASFRIAGSTEASPVAGHANSHAEMTPALESLIENFEFRSRTMLESIVEGDRAAIHWTMKLRHRRTGVEHDTEFYDLWTVRDGKAVAFVQFLDTALLKQMGGG